MPPRIICAVDYRLRDSEDVVLLAKTFTSDVITGRHVFEMLAGAGINPFRFAVVKHDGSVMTMEDRFLPLEDAMGRVDLSVVLTERDEVVEGLVFELTGPATQRDDPQAVVPTTTKTVQPKTFDSTLPLQWMATGILALCICGAAAWAAWYHDESAFYEMWVLGLAAEGISLGATMAVASFAMAVALTNPALFVLSCSTMALVVCDVAFSTSRRGCEGGSVRLPPEWVGTRALHALLMGTLCRVPLKHLLSVAFGRLLPVTVALVAVVGHIAEPVLASTTLFTSGTVGAIIAINVLVVISQMPPCPDYGSMISQRAVQAQLLHFIVACVPCDLYLARLLALHALEVAVYVFSLCWLCATLIEAAVANSDMSAVLTQELESLREKGKRRQVDNAMKSTFLATISHEMRTPLNGVIGMAGLLMDTQLDSLQKDYTWSIQKSAVSLLTIINDLLDFSESDQKSRELDWHDFSVLEVLDETLQIIASAAEEKGVELVSEVKGDVPGVLNGDAPRIRHILINALSNAVKFTEHGTIALSVCLKKPAATSSRSQQVVNVEFAIQDSGIGIPRDMLHRLFTPFLQGEDSTTRRFGGTGLGLTNIRNSVHLFNGLIRVESTVGKGTNFSVILPLRVPEDPDPNSKRGTFNATHIRVLESCRMLVLESCRTNGEAISGVLKRVHLRKVTNCSGVTEAMNSLRNAKQNGDAYDGVILDVEPSNVTASAGLAQCIAADPELRDDVFIMALTQITGPPLDRFIERKVVHVVTKPMHPMRLIGSLLSGYTQRRSGVSVTAMVVEPLMLSPNVSPSSLFPVMRRIPRDGSSRNLMPADLSQEPSSAKSVDDDRSPRSDVSGFSRVLLVEDHPTIQKVVSQILRQEGYTVDVVGNGELALRAFGERQYGVILMDCLMPVMDGFRACELIREAESDVPLSFRVRTPVVALSACALPTDRQRCRSVGMDDYLTKPVQRKDLLVVVEMWQRKKQLAVINTFGLTGGPRTSMASEFSSVFTVSPMLSFARGKTGSRPRSPGDIKTPMVPNRRNAADDMRKLVLTRAAAATGSLEEARFVGEVAPHAASADVPEAGIASAPAATQPATKSDDAKLSSSKARTHLISRRLLGTHRSDRRGCLLRSLADASISEDEIPGSARSETAAYANDRRRMRRPLTPTVTVATVAHPIATQPVSPVEIEHKGLRVLYVDDTALNLRIVAKFLETQGHSCATAHDGIEGVKRFVEAHERAPFDLVLMDLSMPNMDGFEAARQIIEWERSHNLAHTPIVPVTALSGADVKRDCLAAGMQNFIAKPVDRKELVGTIETVMSGARQIRSAAQKEAQKQ